ncbi:hypothetical protein H0H87_009326 [Tephrocybe sp. NHM501043]|nr:hypothetical protein H0H87_009326 [Tephrocybe sp. NHM501043]
MTRQARSIASSISSAASGGGGGTGLSKEERALAFVANRWLQKKVIIRNPWAKTLTAGDYRNEAIEIANEARLSREPPLLPSQSIINYLSHSFSLARAPFCNQALQLLAWLKPTNQAENIL